MTNYVHLVIDLGGQAEHLAMLMKRVVGRYARYINKKESRFGTLWEGRYKSSLIDKNEYLLACCRYVEMNPVRAGAVFCPQDYIWSSCRAKAGLIKEGWFAYDAFYTGLGKSEQTRQERYREWMRETISDAEEEFIRQAARRSQLTGGSRFVDEIEKNWA